MPDLEQIEQFFTCPYCWKTISILIDTSVDTQRFVEDCENCCHPIEFSYAIEEGQLIAFETVKFQ